MCKVIYESDGKIVKQKQQENITRGFFSSQCWIPLENFSQRYKVRDYFQNLKFI